MEIPMASAVTACSVCGEPLNAKGQCLACLFRIVLDESIAKSAPPVSLVFGDFEIVRREDGSLWELGRGAFGVTYLAVDNVLRRKVALKVIDVPAAARTSQAVRERFLREARAAAALRHPNVAAVYQFGALQKGSHCYYAMELVEGETLEARVRRDGPLNAKQALEIAIQITRALMAATANGLVHRDLKPGNIMLTRGDADLTELEVKVIDFGLAKAIADAAGEMDLTHGEFVGTPNFASPEQFQSGSVDVRSDIYSLGATLWFALTGKTPFAGRSIEEIRTAQKSTPLPIEQLKAARVPPSLRSLLESMLAFEPAARPGIQDLAAQLRRCSALAEIEMTDDVKKEIQLEIAHVLFIDIVGYSTLSINEQHAAVDELTRIVRSTEQFKKADAADRMLKIPSGDGMALVFYTTPEAPVRCAMEIARALQDRPRLHIRMGIHSGPVRGVVDVTGRPNLAGAGLNLAQRVMECGDAGHILLSKHVAEDLSEFDEWRPLLHDLGTCEVKHGVQIAVVNFSSDDVGNRQHPQKFQALRKKRARVRWAELVAVVILLAAIVAAFVLVSRKSARPTSSTPEKSIAVLPFENLSEDKTNSYFADGVQDEILTDLARIADLKVISRTSVMHYKSGVARNLREIGQQLGVANVVEGSVQRSGNRVRVNAQLVDARTDRHLWGQTYDRDLADVFAIQSEIAKTIADQLQAKLSPAEKSAIDLPPTNDLVAFDLYTRAKDLILTARLANADKADSLSAIEVLNQAVARDPSFFDAYCQLANVHDLLYLVGLDHTPARLALAEAAVDAAVRLRPDAGETHLARAQNLYSGHRDYNGALAELELARQTLPNDARVYQLMGFIQRRQKGRYEEATRTLEHAIDLDPRNVLTLMQIAAFNYRRLGRHADAKAAWDRLLAIRPDDNNAKVLRASVDFDWKADTRPLHQTIDSIRATNPDALQSVADAWLLCALAERDADAAKNALVAIGEKPISPSNENLFFSRQCMQGVIARMAQDDAAARSAFTAARAEQEKIVQDQPSYGPAVCILGLIDAGLGRKEEAIREGRRAIELLPVEKDLPHGMDIIKYLAMIAAWVGDKDLACEQLAIAISGPSSLTYGELKLLPFWDPLRGDPRFEKLVEEAKLPPALRASESDTHSGANFAAAPERSIAVLPFENRSRDPDNAYLAEGIQDEILTRLSKIADLKVISRTSTQHYKNAPENLPEIGKQLGVAHILEGSVQKSGDTVRVNVQLIKAVDDSHLWAETFDRKLTDIFSVESEVAKTIADQLRAKLTGQEEQVIASKPTDNTEAYDAYLRALAYWLKPGNTPANAFGAQKYLREAVRLDPKFALAWALLSRTDARGYLTGSLQPTVALREEARHAAETALTLQPSLGEAILAKGQYYYGCLKDYDTAVRYYEQARQFLPNGSQIPESLAYVERRRGQWDRSESYFNEAEQLDPRNVNLLAQRADSYTHLRRFPDALRKLDEVLNITPDDVDTLVLKAGIAQAEGDLPQAAALLAPLHPNADDSNAVEQQVYQAILERHPAPAISRLKEILAKPDPALGYVNGELRFWLGWAQQVAGDHTAAQESFQQARSELETLLKEQPENFILISDLALTNTALGDKARALALAERAMAVNPIEKDAVTGPGPIEVLARVAAQTGEPDRAIAAIQKLLSIPYGGPMASGPPLTPALLRLDPMFDPLRNDPRFQKLIASPAPNAN